MWAAGGLVVAGFVAGFVACHLLTRRHRRLRIDWQLIIDSDETDGTDGG